MHVATWLGSSHMSWAECPGTLHKLMMPEGTLRELANGGDLVAKLDGMRQSET